METHQQEGKDMEMGDVKSLHGGETLDSASLPDHDHKVLDEDDSQRAEPRAHMHERRISWAPQPRREDGRDYIIEEEEDIANAEEGSAVSDDPVAGPSSPTRAFSASHDLPLVRPRPRPGRSSMQGRPLSAPSGEKEKDVVPDAIGTETCPICIVDFEEGDDLRVLPCEGHHRFHRDCVDQWLLELSSSCPICRQGALTFHTTTRSLYLMTDIWCEQTSTRWRR